MAAVAATLVLVAVSRQRIVAASAEACDRDTVLLQLGQGASNLSKVEDEASSGAPKLPATYGAHADVPVVASAGLPAPKAPLRHLDSPLGLVEQQRLEQLLGSPSAAELEHFRLLKELRTRGFRCPSRAFAGIPDTEATFKFDCRLWRAARIWSSEMGSKGFFSHVYEGSDPCQRTSAQGLRACAENIAAGNGSPSATLDQWKESDGHCVNMMDPRKNRFGIGYAATPGSPWTHYWTQSMGTDNSGAPDQSCLSSTEVPSPSPDPRPPQNEPCEDFDVHCATHYSPYCRMDRVRAICPKTCGACSEECVDLDVHCESSYKSYCYAEHVKRACPKTCGAC